MPMFRSFFMGGFECADHINRSGQRVNLLFETDHHIKVREDYRALAEMGILTTREGICWSHVARSSGEFDFSEVRSRIDAANEFGIQQIWDLCHFGYPDGLYPTHPGFDTEFAALCWAFATFYKDYSQQPLFVVPINEISFLAWHSGDVRGTVPFLINSGFDIKFHLCKAAIAGINTLRKADPGCTIVLVEPLIKVHAGPESTMADVYNMNEAQFQAIDIILGRMCPELGGGEDMADVLGFNYYWNCQWEAGGETLPWPEDEPRREPFAWLLKSASERYRKPLFLSETGHFGSGREEWIEEITAECVHALEMGVALHGLCIYPVTDRPDWDDLTRYFQCGIWDLGPENERLVHESYIQSISQCMRHLKSSIVDSILSRNLTVNNSSV